MKPVPETAHPAWERALREHREAVAGLGEVAAGADAECWGRAAAPGKWSPAQIAEHLLLTYEALLRDLAGAASLRPRVRPAFQRVLRWVVLPHILFHQSIPVRVVAPREVRPSQAGLDPPEFLRRLPALAERFEHEVLEIRDAPRAITHPYFGPIPPLKALRFCSAHLQHHRRQMRAALATNRAPR